LEIDANPYSAPSAKNEPAGPFFPWRLIPASVIGLLGILSFGFGTYFAAIVACLVFAEGITSGVQESLGAIVFYIGPGVAWTTSSLLLWKKRYAFAILLVLAGLSIPLTLQP
jgi:hypothetical protein